MCVLVWILVAVRKYPDQSNFEKEGFTLAQVQVLVHDSKEVTVEEIQRPDYIPFIVKSRKE